MASAEEIAALRLLIGEPTEDMYTDASLSDRLDAAASPEALAATIWLEKSARYARLVDMQEGTSRRSLSQLQEQALAMATRFQEEAGGSAGGSRRTTTRAIVRL